MTVLNRKYVPHHSLFDLKSVFFSCRDSYLSFSHTKLGVPDGLYLRHIRGGATKPEMFRLNLLHDGKNIPFHEILTPTLLKLESEFGWVQICFEKPDLLRFYGKGVNLELHTHSRDSEFDTAWQEPDGSVNAILYASDIKCKISSIRGNLRLNSPWLGSKTDYITIAVEPSNDNEFDITIHSFLSTPEIVNPLPTFEHAHESVQSSFEIWQDSSLSTADAYIEARELATYINWASIVAPRGNFTRSAMLMSKNLMSKIWGWDNCFNALAHVDQDPELAWDQLMLFVDHQLDDGALVDHITDMTQSSRFYKPPIYGWTIQEMQSRTTAITDDKIAQIYRPLAMWTKWWLEFRDDDKDGLPQYNHGNESGWDNGTAFAHGLPVESPDLATYLILQMDFLAQTAEDLGLLDEIDNWKAQADHLMNVLVEQLWAGDHFIARHAYTHQPYDGNSLLMCMPLLLGERLPDTIRDALIDKVTSFLTDYGLATEHPGSIYYEADGYWRGPIWAPSTYLIFKGLLACGATDIAHIIAKRFCDMALTNGMAENYDAMTGFGLRDRAYTWTSSVFLLLANWLQNEMK